MHRLFVTRRVDLLLWCASAMCAVLTVAAAWMVLVLAAPPWSFDALFSGAFLVAIPGGLTVALARRAARITLVADRARVAAREVREQLVGVGRAHADAGARVDQNLGDVLVPVDPERAADHPAARDARK
jgi:hypothetical protein